MYKLKILDKHIDYVVLPALVNLKLINMELLCLKIIFIFFRTAIPLSEDHKPNRSDERRRIEKAGGVVMWAGMYCSSHN